MVYTVKLDKNNYFLDKSTGNIVDRYDPTNKNLELILTLPDSILKVDASSIIQEYGGSIAIQHLDNKYIIDDGYQDIMIKCGYIVYKNYDHERINNITKGLEIRNKLIKDVRDALNKLAADKSLYSVFTKGNETIMRIYTNNYCYKFRFDSISSIVTKNYARKDNGLTYYPFDKSKDKYGTIYVSIFAKKLEASKDNNKYDTPNNIITELIKLLGLEYHFVSMPIKGRILFSTDI